MNSTEIFCTVFLALMISWIAVIVIILFHTDKKVNVKKSDFDEILSEKIKVRNFKDTENDKPLLEEYKIEYFDPEGNIQEKTIKSWCVPNICDIKCPKCGAVRIEGLGKPGPGYSRIFRCFHCEAEFNDIDILTHNYYPEQPDKEINDKNTPLKRKNIITVENDDSFQSECPSCGGMLYEEVNIIFEYCPWCAQKLDNHSEGAFSNSKEIKKESLTAPDIIPENIVISGSVDAPAFTNRCIICGGSVYEINSMVCQSCRDAVKYAKEKRHSAYHPNNTSLT